MDVHLRTGCPECGAVFNAWQTLTVFAQDERELTPPEDVLRVAKSYLAQRKQVQPAPTPASPLTSWASATLATLVFDSRQAAPAGVRAAAAVSRHLMFDAKWLLTELDVEAVSPAGEFLVSGQVADVSRPDQPLQNIWLSIVDDRKNVNMFQTNEFGEFRCTLNRRDGLKLIVYASQDVVAIPLDTIFDPSNDPAEPGEHGR